MKKIIGFLLFFLLLVSAIFYHQTHQPKNIFDEIYLETKRTYRNSNVLGKIKDFNIRDTWASDDPNISETPFGEYNNESTPNSYYNISIDFNFREKYSLILVSFEKLLNSGDKIWVLSKYNPTSKTLTKTIQIILEPQKSSVYTENETEVKAYLTQYGITAEDLDSYYDEIVNQKVLQDWCSIYNSQFSPEDYGQVTVKAQWEDW